jgi:two-component system chemotaxis response regulator CheY
MSKKILIVDDALFMRESIKNMLINSSDIEVVGEAANGIEGVELYSRLRPDIVTMDITMPDMGGIEALQKIREIDPEARVIMISAMGQEGMVKQSIISGAKTFVVKPFSEDVLISTINKILAL